MQLTRERSRDALVTPSEKIKERFGSLVTGAIDAEFTDADGERVIGVCGLPFSVPMCFSLTNNEKTAKYLSSFGKTDHLFVVCGDRLTHYTERGKQPLTDDLSAEFFSLLRGTMNGFGSLTPDGAHEIVLKDGNVKSSKVGLHYDVNLLLGNRADYPDPMLTTPKSAVDSLGRGSFRSGAARQVLASRFTLVPEENGDPVNRQFYIVENGKQTFYSANLDDNVKRAVCRHEVNRTVIEYETEDGLLITRTIFILPQEDGMPEAVEAQIIDVKNLTDRKREIKTVATGMFGLCSPESTMSDIIYASITWEGGVVRDGETAVAVVPSPNPNYLAPNKRFATLISSGGFFDGYCTSYSEFIGSGSVLYPDGAVKLSSKNARKIVPFFAMEKTETISPGDTAEFVELVGMTLAKGGKDEYFLPLLSALLEKYRKPGEIRGALERSIKFFGEYCGYIKTHTGDEKFDSYVGSNLPFQVCYQSFVSRSFAWTQKAFREIGFREIQDLEAGLYYFTAMGRSDLVKTMLGSWVSNVHEMGYANHNFYASGKEPGVCSDDQLWLAQAIYRYVTLTGDTEFLSCEYPTADTGEKRTVFGTLMKTIEYSGRISVGSHGLPLMDRGDWNDCLKLDADHIDGPTKKQRYLAQLAEKGQEYGVPFENDYSESVMNAFLLKIAIDETAALAKMIGKTEESAALCGMSSELAEKIRDNCWINGFFVRALIGGGRKYKYLGSEGDGLDLDGIGGTYYLNSFSWSILSGVASEEQISSMLAKVEKYLKTESGLKLCTAAALDRLEVNTSTSYYFPGDRENGGVFKHATMMATCAMLKAAKEVDNAALAEKLSALAFWMIGKVMPYRCLEDPYVLCGNPRFCTQYNNSRTGENIGPMLSGTASWLALTVFEMLGISYDGENMRLSPVLPFEYTSVSYDITHGDAHYTVTVRKQKGFCRVGKGSACLLDGKTVPFAVPKNLPGKHSIEITM